MSRKTCPFCGWHFSDRVPLGGFRATQRDVYVVVCCSCKAVGPPGQGKAEADRFWDSRGAPVEVVKEPGTNVIRLVKSD